MFQLEVPSCLPQDSLESGVKVFWWFQHLIFGVCLFIPKVFFKNAYRFHVSICQECLTIVMLWYPAMMVVGPMGQLSNPILSELGWLDIGHRETKRETAPAPEKWGGKPWKFGDEHRTWRLSHHVWLCTATFSGCFFCSILAVRFPDPPVNSLHLGGLKMREGPQDFSISSLPKFDRHPWLCHEKPVVSQCCEWQLASVSWFWNKSCWHKMHSKNLLCKSITTNFN